ncbi:magnesium and cobalt transporter [Humidesulfovibrio mexicanus]|uniref:Magnesium and cobalt transporter n=2 Tax=Humidesulfovibrio mexicanus TaxID=147047 RepID=A0A239CZ58_9BACT|nr:magnesium and cobalt transporter [Humidesulfovibrio mexicanus]
MDEGSNGTILSAIRNLFRKADSPLDEMFKDAVAEGEIKSDDVRVLQNVIDLEDRHVSEIMIPRPDIICAEQDSPLAEVAELIIQHGHSRIPIYRDNRDHMVGVVHAKDILGPLLQPSADQPLVTGIMRPVHFVPETTNLKSLLHDMQSRKIHLAVALDEYGGTAGLVTMEDVLEQIVGEIGDEYDSLRPEDVQELPDGSQIVSGRVSLDEINERFGLELNSELVESIGGHISELAGRIPAVGESFDLGEWRFQVHEADAKHIETLRVLRAE